MLPHDHGKEFLNPSGARSPWRILALGSLSLLLPVALAWLNPSLPSDQELQVQTLTHTSDDASLTLENVMTSGPSAWIDGKFFALGPNFLRGHTVWTRSDIPRTLAGDELVAVIELPISHMMDFYLVEDGRVIDQSRTSLDPPVDDNARLATAVTFKLKPSQVDRSPYLISLRACTGRSRTEARDRGGSHWRHSIWSRTLPSFSFCDDW